MSRSRWLAIALFIPIACGFAPVGKTGSLLQSAAWGQSTGQRTVSGTVTGDGSDAVVGATVFLKNQKTKAIRSYTSTADGHFHFAQINMSDDFDLWAEKEGKKSAVKTVSSWDARKDFISDLKLK